MERSISSIGTFEKESGIVRNRFFKFSILLILLIILAFSTFIFFINLESSEGIISDSVTTLLYDIQQYFGTSKFFGAFFITLIGGLFFVFVPLEIIFVGLLALGQPPFFLIAMYLLGLSFSYSANYFIGSFLSRIPKKLISKRRYVKLKRVINRSSYSGGVVFLFNFLPLPSQPLSALLGVFKYETLKFYLYTFSGQVLKYLFLTLIYFLSTN